MTYTLDELWRLAEMAYTAQLVPPEVAFSDVRTQEMFPPKVAKSRALMLMQTGVELGLQPLVALRTVQIVKGRTSLASQVMLALALGAGVRIEWEASSDKVARLRLYRDGREHLQEFTIAQARASGIARGATWDKHTDAMLRARCVSTAIRAFCPDLVSGLHTPDELGSSEAAEADTTPTPQVTTEPAGPPPMELTAEWVTASLDYYGCENRDDRRLVLSAMGVDLDLLARGDTDEIEDFADKMTTADDFGTWVKSLFDDRDRAEAAKNRQGSLLPDGVAS